MNIPRSINLPELLKKKSFFLFGPRTTGKTTLIKEQLNDGLIHIDLLKSQYYLRLSADPGELEQIIFSNNYTEENSVVVIDEVQKVPSLLDEVHRLIEEKGIRFLLTGSSARKLKRGAANLLAGRAWTAELFPLTFDELKGEGFDLERYLHLGGLPSVYTSSDPVEELDAYVHTYLYEELQAEGIVRKLTAFSKFLTVAALSNGEVLNYTKVASDCQIAASTIREYFSVLEDTLLGFSLHPWVKSKKRKATQTAKFYLFDPGVTHHISGTKSFDRNSNLYGKSFEQFIAMELRAFISYKRIKNTPLSYWRSTNGHEVDFLIGDEVAIEVKSSKQISDRDLKGLKALQEEGLIDSFYLVSQDPVPRLKDGIFILPWDVFLTKLWAGEVTSERI
jgi:predicted AAA+ superfamily ATPase